MQRTYTDGEIFLYRGEPRRLMAPAPADGAAGAPERTCLSADGACLCLPPLPPEARRASLLHWYTAETEKIIRALLPAWCKKLLLRPRCADVRYAKTRWGSCSTSGRLFFNSRLAMLSEDVAEYIVVHELCHLQHMNHGRAFWDAVESALPQSRALRARLRQEERDAVL